MQLEISYVNQFKKDLRKMQKQGKALEKLHTVISKLARGEALAQKYRDHLLKGNYAAHRECHIEPDWLLIYKTVDNRCLRLVRTGSHAELFK